MNTTENMPTWRRWLGPAVLLTLCIAAIALAVLVDPSAGAGGCGGG